MPVTDLKMYEEETTITYIYFLMYQVYTVEPMIFCVDTGAPLSCIRNKALKRIFRHPGRRHISGPDSKRDFKFGDTFGMIEKDG